MIRFGIIFGLLFQSLVAICCGQLMAARAGSDGCGTTGDACCCCPIESTGDTAGEAISGNSCCVEPDIDSCCSGSASRGLPSCECCVLTQDVPLIPASPEKRPTTDTTGVALATLPTGVDSVAVWRETVLLARRHEPPWPSGRALLADQCRWNL